MNNSTVAKSTTITTLGNGGPIDIGLNNAILNGTINDAGSGINFYVGAGTKNVNHGTIHASATDYRTKVAFIGTAGNFTNAGHIIAGSGSDVTAAVGDAATNTQQTFDNSGLIRAESGGSVTLQADHLFTQSAGTVGNSGRLDADGGTMTINATLAQSAKGRVTAENGGTINLGGVATGGSIALSDSTLVFGLPVTRFGNFPAAAASTSKLALLGVSDRLTFSSLAAVTEVFKPGNELVVSAMRNGMSYQIADLHLSGHYSADEFSVHGGSVDYLAHSS